MKHNHKMWKNRAFKRFNSQRGWTMWSVMFVMTVAFIAAYVVMQLVPIYSANSSVVNAMRASIEGKDLRTISRAQVIKGMQKQLYLDGSHGLLNYKNGFKMGRSRNQFVLEVNYEREVPLVSNIFLLVRFNPKVECELSGRCDP